jgi:hypothetical protein
MTFLQTSPKEECRPADIPFVVWYYPVQTMALLASCWRTVIGEVCISLMQTIVHGGGPWRAHF